MQRIFQAALIVAACSFLVSLIYVELPFTSFEEKIDEQAERTALPVVQVKDALVSVEIVDTSAERERGLSGREGLAPDSGMLFIFEEDGYPAFWMKDMRFAIDILWVASDGAIVHIEESVAPETYPTAFAPRRKARYVVELPDGYAKAHEIHIGDLVRLDAVGSGFSTASSSEMFQSTGVQ